MAEVDAALSALPAVANEGFDQRLRDWADNYLRIQQHRYRDDIRLVVELASAFDEPKILEVGGMPFHVTWCLKRLGYDVTTLDLAPERADIFIRKHDLDVVCCDIETQRLAFDDQRFDLVIMCEVFEHLRIDLIHTFSEINRVLKPGGRLLLTSPNIYHWRNIKGWIKGRGPGPHLYPEYKKLRDYGHMGHVREYSRWTISEFLRQMGFQTDGFQYRLLRPLPKSKRTLFRRILFSLLPQTMPFMILKATKRSDPVE